MSNYTQTTFFAPKDGFSTGNPDKTIFGAEIDPEFSAISVAIATKVDTAGTGLEITSTTMDLSLTDLTAATPVAADELVFADASDSNNEKKVTAVNFLSAFVGDSMQVLGNALEVDINSVTVETTVDGANDTILFYDDDAGALRKATVDNALAGGSGYVPNTRSITAGDGLTGGGDLSADRTINVGAGNGINVSASQVSLDPTVAGDGLTHSAGVLAVGAGDGISVAANTVSVDIAGQTDLGTTPADTDELLINDGGTIKKVAVSDLLAGANISTSVEKAVSENVTSSTTLQDDDELVLTNLETGLYRVHLLLRVRDVSAANIDLKMELSPSGWGSDNFMRVQTKLFSGSGALSFDEAGKFGDTFDNIGLESGSATTTVVVEALGEVTLGSNTLTLQWAQQASSANQLRVESGSWISATKIG